MIYKTIKGLIPGRQFQRTENISNVLTGYCGMKNFSVWAYYRPSVAGLVSVSALLIFSGFSVDNVLLNVGH
jgi:hypothetical protein